MANDKRSSLVPVAIGLSLLNLVIIIAGVLWVHDAFQEAERADQGVAETLKPRIESLFGALQGVGGVLIVGVLLFGFIWLVAFYQRAARKATLEQQAADLSSYLKNRARD